jgi:hypothetical protein
VLKATFVAVPAVTVTPELTAVVRATVESVAVRVHGLVPPSITRAAKLATPPLATALVVPAKVQAEVITIVSVNPLVDAWLAAFSTFTENDVTATPETAVAGGSGEKASFDSVAATIVTAALVTAGNELVVSVAVRAQAAPAVIVTAAKVATPELARTVSVPPRVQPAVEVEIVTESLLPVPVVVTAPVLSSTETAKLVRATPRVAFAGGAVVNATWNGAPAAEAGVAVTINAPATTSAEHAPTERILPSAERSVRPPPRVFIFSMVSPLPYKRFI